MPQESQPTASMFSQVDLGTGDTPAVPASQEREQIRLLRQMAEAQQRQTELLEELVGQMGAGQRQRNQDLANWRSAHPRLARECRSAAEKLTRVQMEFLEKLIDEVHTNADALADGEFMLNEFVDRFGPRLAHLNGVLQVLSQLSATPRRERS